MPIAQIEPGDLVLTRDEDSGLVSLHPVLAVITTDATALVEVTVRHASGHVEILESADEHPFWVEGRGWTRVDALVPGDVTRTLTGSATVDSVRLTGRRATVYDLSVAGNPSFLIGVDGVWVHNCLSRGVPVPLKEAQKATRGFGGEIQAHHLIEKRHFDLGAFTHMKHGDVPGVVLEQAEHQKVTNLLRDQLPMDGTVYSPQQIRNAYREVYLIQMDRPEWWHSIQMFLQ